MTHETSSSIDPETRSLLPDLIPAKYYPDPFYAKVAESYWSVNDNPSLAYLTQHVLRVARTLTSPELFELAKLIDKDFPAVETDIEGERLRIWDIDLETLDIDKPGNLFIRADKNHTAIGHVSQVVAFIENHYGIGDNTSDELETTLIISNAIAAENMIAAENYRDAEFPNEIETSLQRESSRRVKLPNKILDTPIPDQLEKPITDD
jgi:hypothetical protein